MKYKVGDKVILTNGNIMTIDQINDKFKWYLMREDPLNCYTDEMIEGLVDITQDRVDKIACKIDEELPSGNPYEWECPEGYIFKDENGNVINTTKIVLEKKKKEYPKTYEECCKVMKCDPWFEMNTCYHGNELSHLYRLLICRDAYWKIAGDEMGLGKPWSPIDSDYITGRYCIFVHRGNIICDTPAQDCIFSFPTEEMRDAFKENFDSDIEICKEFL